MSALNPILNPPSKKTIAVDFECSDRCRSVQHGIKLSSISLKDTDTQIISFWSQLCQNYSKVRDDLGRSALHVASMIGRENIVKWLVKNGATAINGKELTSGYTPLHMSIIFGNIHVTKTLIDLGANPYLTDNEGLSAFDLLSFERSYLKNSCYDSQIAELHVWGSNDNYNLGIGRKVGKTIPEYIEIFKDFKIKSIVLQQYHSLFHENITNYVYSAGTGDRLGNGQKTSLTPKQIYHLNGKALTCKCIAAGPDHSIFIASNETTWTCGSNKHYVLGHSDTQQQPLKNLDIPKLVDSLRHTKIIGASASQYHSIFYNKTQIFVCGTNTGQMGVEIEAGSYIITPVLVTGLFNSSRSPPIENVYCNDLASVIDNGSGILHLLYKNGRRKIDIKNFSKSASKVCVIGGSYGQFYSDNGPNSQLCLLIYFDSTESLLVWRDNNSDSGLFTRLIFNIRPSISITQFCYGKDSLVLLSKNGEAYKSTWNPFYTPHLLEPLCKKTNKTTTNDEKIGVKEGPEFNTWKRHKIRAKGGSGESLSSLNLEQIRLKRIPNIFNATFITCDPKGINFAAIQESILDFPLDHTELNYDSPNISESLLSLYNESSLEDNLHDLEIKVGYNVYPCHRFIISSSCESLKNQIQNRLLDSPQEFPVKLELNGIKSFAFEEVLKFCYSNNFDILCEMREDVGSKMKECISCARLLGCQHYINSLTSFPKIDEEIKYFSPKIVRKSFTYDSSLNFFDFELKTSDGRVLKVHKCILVARLQYFYNMFFANIWSDSKAGSVDVPFSYRAMSLMLKYVYGGYEGINFLEGNDLDLLCEVLQASDLYQCIGLFNMCQVAMSSFINMRNVSYLLQISFTFHAQFLKESSMNFLNLNLVYLLENRMLDELESEIIKSIAQHYKTRHRKMSCRTIDISSSESSSKDEYRIDTLAAEFIELVTNKEINDTEITSTTVSKKRTPVKMKSIKKPATPTIDRPTNTFLLFDEVEEIEPKFSSSPKTKEDSLKWTKISNLEKRKLARDRKNSESDSQSIVGSPVQNSFYFDNGSNSPKENSFTSSITAKKPINIPKPLKENAIRAENHKMSLFEPKFESLNDFPSLGIDLKSSPIKESPLETSVEIKTAPLKPIESIAEIMISQNEEISKRSTSKNEEFSKTPKKGKKTKWVSLTNVELSPQASSNVKKTNEENSSNCLESPKNPWKIPEIKSPKKTETEDNFGSILRQEEEQLENLSKALKKQIPLVQIEDGSMEELLKMYTTQDTLNGFEILRIERRVNGSGFLSPIWPTNSNSNANPSTTGFDFHQNQLTKSIRTNQNIKL